MKPLVYSLLAIGALLLSGCNETTPTPKVVENIPTGPVSTADFPTSITIVLDTSGSMEELAGNESRIKSAVSVLQNWIAKAPTGVVWSLYTFQRDEPIVAYTKDRNEVAKSLTALRVGGGTPLFKTCVNAVDYMKKREKAVGTEHAILLILTDGMDSNYSATHVANWLKTTSNSVTTYMIGFSINDPAYSASVSNFSFVTNAASLETTLDNIPLEK